MFANQFKNRYSGLKKLPSFDKFIRNLFDEENLLNAS
jgi:hypothetical protein